MLFHIGVGSAWEGWSRWKNDECNEGKKLRKLFWISWFKFQVKTLSKGNEIGDLSLLPSNYCSRDVIWMHQCVSHIGNLWKCIMTSCWDSFPYYTSVLGHVFVQMSAASWAAQRISNILEKKIVWSVSKHSPKYQADDKVDPQNPKKRLSLARN